MSEVIKNEPKYRSIMLDTLNQLMMDKHTELMEAKGRGATYDEWRDFGVDIQSLYTFLKSLSNTVLVQILGKEGTGKTVGGSFLDPDENYWLNIDKKPLTFTKARQMYSTEKKNYAVVTGYEKVREAVTQIHNKAKSPLIIFVTGHIEDYKDKNGEIASRLKTLGKQATKYNIEGAVAHTYYTYVDRSKKALDPTRYMLSAFENRDTARSPMGMWETEFIPNNLQLIVDKIVADWQ